MPFTVRSIDLIREDAKDYAKWLAESSEHEPEVPDEYLGAGLLIQNLFMEMVEEELKKLTLELENKNDPIPNKS